MSAQRSRLSGEAQRARIDMINALRAHLGSVPLELGVLTHIGTPDSGDVWSRILAPGADPARLMAWCSAMQKNERAQIWIRPDPAVTHPWLLVDDVPVADALAFAARRAALVIETSPGNTQLRVLSDQPLSMLERTQAQRVLCAHLHGDPGSIAGDKWGRLPGFKNQKPGRDCWTNLLRRDLAGRPVSATALLAHAIAAPAVASAPAAPALLPSALPGRGCVPSGQGSPSALRAHGARPVAGQSGRSGDRSAKHFAYACHALRRGEDPALIARKVADRALQDGKRGNETAAMAYALGLVATAQVRIAMER